MENKKRKFTLKEVDKILGYYDGGDYNRTVVLLRKELKEFKFKLSEIASLCKMHHVSPYDVFKHNPEMADRVMDEILKSQHTHETGIIGRLI